MNESCITRPMLSKTVYYTMDIGCILYLGLHTDFVYLHLPFRNKAFKQLLNGNCNDYYLARLSLCEIINSTLGMSFINGCHR